MKVLVIEPGSQTATVREVAHTLTAFQELVGGDIEGLTLGSGVTAYINEGGKGLGLPVNVVADEIVRILLVADGRRLMPGDVIVGPVVFLGSPDGDGEDTGVPSEFVEWVGAFDGFTVEGD